MNLVNQVGEVIHIEKEPAGDWAKIVLEHNAPAAHAVEGFASPAMHAAQVVRWHTVSYVPMTQAAMFHVGQRVRFAVVPDERDA